ncbi:MAG TPA: endonuclease Q family protein [Cerasibacillus sp.]|uniref:endonuclease Q family protein n=1 Tax=Cerasibacillus sp. TaxID=2498711 RepID=UPI002F3F159B
MSLQTYFADMHIHIGRDKCNQPVKITASNQLTLTRILKEASRRKGIDLIGVIDAHAPNVLLELKELLEAGFATELTDGGIRFEKVTLLLGAEIEVYDAYCRGPIHVLCYVPTVESMDIFSSWLKGRMTNISLSSQRFYGSAQELQQKVKELAGLFIPAHVFTPFKSLYGKGVVTSLREVLDPKLIDGIELGLSSDTSMADQIQELHSYTFLTNSDAHSLKKIAREYQQIALKEPSFKEFSLALKQEDGRRWIRNFGMNPKLGKYYATVCQECMHQNKPGANQCVQCGGKKIIKGVRDRITEIGQADMKRINRPPYLYQVPLEFLPKLGPKTYERLLTHFNTEMNILHHVSYEQLIQVIQPSLAMLIIQMREGKLDIIPGGGGKYGRVKK